MRTALIYPGAAGRGFNSLSQGMDASWLSHGLASISAAAKAQGFEIDPIDLRALRDLGYDLDSPEVPFYVVVSKIEVSDGRLTIKGRYRR